MIYLIFVSDYDILFKLENLYYFLFETVRKSDTSFISGELNTVKSFMLSDFSNEVGEQTNG